MIRDLLLSAARWAFTFTFPLAEVQAAGPGGSLVPLSDSSAPAGQLNTSFLEQRCLYFLAQGLAPSTRRAYASGQRKFVEFCRQAGKLHSNGSPCPADEWTLCLFVSFLADSIQHSSIEVYLSAVRSLHIEQGFPDPLLHCLRLQRVLRGVKRSQGSPAARRLPITDSLLLVFHRALDLKIFDHCAFWAACMLGYFGFLRAAEFTVPNLASFSPAIHLSVADIAVDSLQSPTCLRVRIKASKTDPFRQGCHIHIGLGRAPLCAVHALLVYLSVRGNVPGPLFLLANGQPLSRSILTDWLRQIFSTARIEDNFSSHSFRIGAATVASRNGIPDHLMQALGRWISNAYQLYIRTPSEALAGISGQLA